MIDKKVDLTTTQLASAILSFKGKAFSLNGYRPFQEVYDLDPPEMTLKCSRQVGKTLSIGAIKTTKSIARGFFTSLYISPLSQQASRFSTTYLDPFLNSPLVRKHFRDSSSKKNVFEKTLNNGSIMYLSYAETEQDADRVRGVAGDAASFDEVQDIALEALPILYETLSASDYGFKRHYGTAKGEQNTLEVLFKRSNGCEWVVKCDSCGKWSIPWTLEDCLKICHGDHGPVCSHCSHPVDMLKGQWLAARPDIKHHFGFHIPRFILESRTNPKKWGELKAAISNPAYSIAKLSNEVFGLASGVAGRILSTKEAIACCNPQASMVDCWPMDSRGIVSCVLGVDWSVTGGSASYTVITVLGYDYNGKCYVLHTERLNGIDILDQVKRVENLFVQFKCQLVGSDRGVGQLQAELLRQSLGNDRVLPIQYVAAKIPLRYDTAGGFLAADRTMTIDSVILKMKSGRSKFETPKWEQMGSPYWSDALSIFEEESQAGRRLYRKDEGATDDSLHSTVFGHIAYMCVSGQFSLDTIPRDEPIY